MLGEHRDYHRGIFGSLALVNGRRVGRHQHVQLAESISDGPAIEAHSDLARVGFNIVDVADIAFGAHPAREAGGDAVGQVYAERCEARELTGDSISSRILALGPGLLWTRVAWGLARGGRRGRALVA